MFLKKFSYCSAVSLTKSFIARVFVDVNIVVKRRARPDHRGIVVDRAAPPMPQALRDGLKWRHRPVGGAKRCMGTVGIPDGERLGPTDQEL